MITVGLILSMAAAPTSLGATKKSAVAKKAVKKSVAKPTSSGGPTSSSGPTRTGAATGPADAPTTVHSVPTAPSSVSLPAATETPRFASVVDFYTGAGACSLWPVRATPPVIQVPLLGGRFVVASALQDVRTPTSLANALAARHGASFVTVDLVTHGVIGSNVCVNAAMSSYFIDLTQPGTLAC